MSVSQVSGYTVEDPLFGTLDYIPFVSVVSGVARAAFGVLEVVLGTVAFPVQLVLRIGSNKSRFLFNLGVSNIVRGKIALFPIAGNIALYLYDHANHLRDDVQNVFGLKKYQ